MTPMRLDQALVAAGLGADSRARAQALIAAGVVLVDGRARRRSRRRGWRRGRGWR